MENKFIAVLDFASGEVHIYTVQGIETNEEAEEYISTFGHSVKDCSFMIMNVLAFNIH